MTIAFARRAPLVAGAWLVARNPAMKLAASFVLAFFTIVALDPITPTLFLLVGLVALFPLGRVRPRDVLVFGSPILVFALSTGFVNLLTRPGGVPVEVGPFTFGSEGLLIGLSLALRTLAIGAVGMAFVLTTDPGRLLTSLMLQARLSPRFAFGVLAAYRFLPVLGAEYGTLRLAHRMRGEPPARFGWLRDLRRAALPMLVSTVRRAERTGIALEARGLGAWKHRTTWKPTTVDAWDWVMLVGAVVLAIGIPLLGVAGGWFRGFEAITVF